VVAGAVGSQKGKPSEGQLVWQDLLSDWLSVGFSEELFWSLTLRQIDTHFRSVEKRWRRELQQHRWNVWHIAALPKTKRFPTFGEFVTPASTNNGRSLAEQMKKTALAMAKMLR